MSESELSREERGLALLIAAVQFINVLDFVMVMPLGPDFARALAIPESELGVVGGAYTAAAAVAGLAGSAVLDRFDRRQVLAVAMAGLVVGTLLGGFAVGFGTLVAARVVAGLFGGPATSISISIIGDLIPPERRGRAMGIVMGAFSVASVLGVPAGLFMAELFGWRAPFFGVAALGALVSVGVVLKLPPVREHLRSDRPAVPLRALLGRRLVQLSYAMTAIVMMAGFIVIPNLSAYIQGNLSFPRADLKWLYFAGGLVSFVSMRVGGRWVDRFGSFAVGTIGAGLVFAVTLLFFFREPAVTSVLPLFVCFMAAMAFRNVAYNTLTTKVPEPAVRARFQSIQSSVQHAASATGAVLSARLLEQRPVALPGEDEGYHLIGMPVVALVSMLLTLTVPLLLRAVERGTRVARSGLTT